MLTPTFDSVLEVLAKRRFALVEASAGASRAAALLKDSRDPVDAKLVEEFRRYGAALDETRSVVEAMEETIHALRPSPTPDDFRERVIAEIKRRHAFFEERRAERESDREGSEALRYEALTDAMRGLLTFVATL